ncbi:MAG: hypothetical protein RI556_06920 [Hydrogenovibrio sp.]|uniref:recombination directionality factor n=1 Tax=Hydrogenovibrio sp. TaxID=2065821 RepID=UPI002870AC52|nr:hypothetical protein [Hydrogenovibrio sp.]MDR9498889.1 hypothetical protein [Hydrogenovibrio sp.]
MLKGLMITPPVLGRISIGQVVERDGKRLPQKDDQFSVTTQVQNAKGWRKHPIEETLPRNDKHKLREIPVRVLFDNPELNLRAEYSFFDRKTARPICVGNGETCQRRTQEGLSTQPCPGPELCDFAQGQCKPYGRLNVSIESEGQENPDPLGSFILRTSGFNSIRTLSARLAYFAALSGGRLSCLPLALKLRAKSTRQSYGRPIFYVDLALRQGMDLAHTLEAATHRAQSRQALGFDQQALDEAAARGYGNGWTEDDPDSVEAVLEEFYPQGNANLSNDLQGNETASHSQHTTASASEMNRLNQSLHDQLHHSFAAQSPINGPASASH